MALRQATQVVNRVPVPSADAATDLIPIVGDFTVPAGLAINDVVEMVPIPAGYVPVDYVLACEDTDSNGAPAIALDVGVLSGSYGVKDDARTCGSEGAAADQVARAGGVTRMVKKDLALLAPTTADRGFGVKVQAAAATLVTGAKWRMTLYCRPQSEGV